MAEFINIDDELFESMNTDYQLAYLSKKLDSCLDKMDVSRFPWKITFIKEAAYSSGLFGLRVFMFLNTKDPFTREPLNVSTYVGVWKINADPDLENVSLQIRMALKDLITHEVDECLFVDGKQAFNPHAE